MNPVQRSVVTRRPINLDMDRQTIGVQRNSDGCQSVVKQVTSRLGKCAVSELVASRSDERGVEVCIP